MVPALKYDNTEPILALLDCVAVDRAPANDNALTIVQIFPHARGAQRASTHQGEAQLAQRSEQAGGRGLALEYFPSGEIWRNETNSIYELARRYVYSGKELDLATGLLDYGARSYDARQGQWLSPDPAFDGLNLYGFVHNNPINLIDPTGLSAETQSWTNHDEFAGTIWGEPAELGDHVRGPGGTVTSSLPSDASDFGGHDVSGVNSNSSLQMSRFEGGFDAASSADFQQSSVRQDQMTPIQETVSPIDLATGGLGRMVLRLSGRLATSALNSAINSGTSLAAKGAQALGRGSTANLAKGTTLARNLREAKAIEQTMSNPAAGQHLARVT